MSYRGRVVNGIIILDSPGCLPEGAVVEVSPVAAEGATPTLYERLKDIIGIADGLPADFAENHDHYIHGAPKRS